MHFYGPAQRQLQSEHSTEPLASALEAAIVHDHLDEEATAFVESRDFFMLSTVNADGEPTVSYKGGGVNMVTVLDPQTLLFPSYDGNGMFLSMGNIVESAKIGLLFIDFVRPHRLRVQATAARSTDNDDMSRYPGADMVVRATVDSAFVNCGRYIHRHQRLESSPYVPDSSGDAPVPAWKRIDAIQPVLPARDQARVESEGGTINGAEYARRVAEGEP